MILRPTLAFAFAHPAHFIALGFGAGLAPFAPGTFGTLPAFPDLVAAGPEGHSPVQMLALIVALFAAGVWACEITGRHLGIADHGAMVWDEVVAFLLVLALLPAGTGWMVAAFLLFRFFDIVKPPPIRDCERRMKGGFGVMFDDILAALYTLLVIALAKRFLV
ncbi:MAG: phosphatidylglycerophosphatase A [Betaproteobacteria bacterium]|nr:phosphatidylglycerophosphatase A [Betaproteobacteria bacterium]